MGTTSEKISSKRRGKYRGEHSNIDVREARFICEILKGLKYNASRANSRLIRAVRDAVNIVYHAENIRTEREIRSFMRHIKENELTAEDFIDREL